MKDEVSILGSPPLIVCGSLWTKSNIELELKTVTAESSGTGESRGGRPGLFIVPTVSVDVKQHRTLIHTEFRSCVKDEVSILGSPPQIVLMVSVDVKQI